MHHAQFYAIYETKLYTQCFLIQLNTISNKAGQLKLFCKMTLSVCLQQIGLHNFLCQHRRSDKNELELEAGTGE